MVSSRVQRTLGIVRTHKAYPSCQNSSVAAARYDSATNSLVISDWTFGGDQVVPVAVHRITTT